MNRSRSHSLRRSPLTVERLEGRDNPATTFQAFGADAGGVPLVQVINPDGTTLAQFQAFETAFRGGVRTAVGEIDGNPSTVEVVTGAGPGGGPHVRVFAINVATGAVNEIASFFPFEPTFNGGVRVAVGNVGGPDSLQEIIVGADAGGGPRVRTFDLSGSVANVIEGPLGDFFAFEPTFRGGVRVGAGELDGVFTDGEELLVGAGPGGGPRVRILLDDGATFSDTFAFPEDFLGGVNVGVDATGTIGRVIADAEFADLSQRSVALNQLAFIEATTFPEIVVPSGAATETTAAEFSTPPFFGAFDAGLDSGFETLGTLAGFPPFGASPFFTPGFDTSFPEFGTATFPEFGSAGTLGAADFGAFTNPDIVTGFPGMTNQSFFGTPFPTFTGVTTPNTFVTTSGVTFV